MTNFYNLCKHSWMMRLGISRLFGVSIPPPTVAEVDTLFSGLRVPLKCASHFGKSLPQTCLPADLQTQPSTMHLWDKAPPKGWENDRLGQNETKSTKTQAHRILDQPRRIFLIITNIMINIFSLNHLFFIHITVSNKENKDEEFLSFLCLSFGLFLSDVSVLTPKPWKTLTCY